MTSAKVGLQLQSCISCSRRASVERRVPKEGAAFAVWFNMWDGAVIVWYIRLLAKKINSSF